MVRDFVAVLRAHDNGPDFHVTSEHLVEVATKAGVSVPCSNAGAKSSGCSCSMTKSMWLLKSPQTTIRALGSWRTISLTISVTLFALSRRFFCSPG